MDESTAAGLVGHPPAGGAFEGAISSDAEDGRSVNGGITHGSGDTRPVAITEGEQRLVPERHFVLVCRSWVCAATGWLPVRDIMLGYSTDATLGTEGIDTTAFCA